MFALRSDAQRGTICATPRGSTIMSGFASVQGVERRLRTPNHVTSRVCAADAPQTRRSLACLAELEPGNAADSPGAKARLARHLTSVTPAVMLVNHEFPGPIVHGTPRAYLCRGGYAYESTDHNNALRTFPG